jgi:hypothetical protein
VGTDRAYLRQWTICGQQNGQAWPSGSCLRFRMDIIQLMQRLYFVRLPVGNVYLWQDPDGLTLIDAGSQAAR